MDKEIVVAYISLGGLIAVAILSGLVPAYLDAIRARRERISNEQERIREAATKLLRSLANFRHTGSEDQGKAAGISSHQQATADMRGAYDAWALVVMPRLDSSQQERIKEIRIKELGRENLKSTEAQDLSISTEIFELTWVAARKVR